MIISHKHKFIFIKSSKTAGTSIEVFLSAYCGEDDIVTKISEKAADWHVKLSRKNKFTSEGYYNHVGIGEIKQKFAQFDEYYKFTAVRNPLDRLLSLYCWQSIREDFNEWIKYGVTLGRAAHLDIFYKIGDSIAVDGFIRYEHLEDDLKRVCDVIGLEYNAKYLLHYKKRECTDIHVTEQTKEFLRRKFAQELKDFDYEIH